MARLKLLEMNATTREYLHVPVQGNWDNTMTVEIAVVAYGTTPASGDWKTASWYTATASFAAGARLLIGQGTSVVLAAGNYVAWWRVTAGSERPVRKSGIVKIV